MNTKIAIVSKQLRKLLLLLLIISMSSCARKISFGTSTVVPAAEGRVKIKNDKNKNHSVEVSIKNLAEPQRLQPSRKTYVVWMDTEKNGVKNIGQLNASSGLFSSTLKASLSTVTPFDPTRFFITAEDDGTIQYPGAQVVLSTDRF